MSETTIELGDMTVEVVRKKIKNVHLSVYPPNGKVRIAAPEHMKLDTIRVIAIAKPPWIRQQQKKVREQEREAPREYVDRETHLVWGRRYLLRVIDSDGGYGVEVTPSKILLRAPAGATAERRNEIVELWYRDQVREAIVPLLAKWEPVIGVKAGQIYVQRMKTRWGSCNPDTRGIRINTDLAKKPPECLEYILVHELTHLLEPTHNERFIALMDSFMPQWRQLRDELNRLPVRHESWKY